MLLNPKGHYKISFSSDRRSSLRARWDSSYRIIDLQKGCGKSAWRITVSLGRNVPRHKTAHTVLHRHWNAHKLFRFYKFVESEVMCARPDSLQTKCCVYLFWMTLKGKYTSIYTHKKKVPINPVFTCLCKQNKL